MKYCPRCGRQLYDNGVFCSYCGTVLPDEKPPLVLPDNHVHVSRPAQPPHSKVNGVGIFAFIMSIIGFLFLSSPIWVVAAILIAISFIFSIAGIGIGANQGKRKGLSIAGIVISIISFICLLIIIST